MDEVVSLPSPCLVVLVGPGAAGKSTWAATHFAADEVVSSDRLRAVVGAGEDDLSASADAFAVLDEIVRRRVARRLTTVVDTLGLDAGRRHGYRDLARQHGVPCVAVRFDTHAAQCRAWNRARDKRIQVDVLSGQLKSWAATRDLLEGEGFDRIVAAVPVRVVPASFVDAAQAVHRQRETPVGLRFGLHLNRFAFPGDTGEAVGRIGRAAEEAGFDAVYVMDHFRQIPQVGRAWDDFLESYTTLAFLAARTSRVRLGALVTGVTYRNPAHLGKIIATLDVLSGGRAVAGLGLAWFAAEHVAYGWDFPGVGERYALLEDTLRLLPLLWGKGSPAFEGAVVSVPEALCYPRPVQAHVPIIVGGGGERRTLRLAAHFADAANVFGDVRAVRRKKAVLERHCAESGRSVELTHLSTVLVGRDDAEVAELVRRHRPRGRDPARFAAEVNAGTVSDHVGRFRELAEAGVAEVMVALPDLVDPAPIERMAAVIAAFRSGRDST